MNDEHLRERIIDAGIRLLERRGIQALSARNLATEIGTSTMAIYSRFAGMNGVLDAIAEAIFARFISALAAVAETADPVADFFVTGAMYREFALTHPQKYALMFGSSIPSITAHRADIVTVGTAITQPRWATSFDVLRALVRRMIDAGRIRDDDDHVIAGRLWSIIHGAVTLELAGFFGDVNHGLTHILAPLTVDVLIGMGDDRREANASLATAFSRLPHADNSYPS